MKRSISILLIVVMLLSALTVLSYAASGKNTGTRHAVCTELSEQAEAYYAKNNISYDDWLGMDGEDSGSCLKAVDTELYKALHDLMADTMTASVSYSSLTTHWKTTDSTPNSGNNPVLFYSDTPSGNYNREHVWPKSRASFLQTAGGSDLHHLRPTNSTINSTRSNYTMGNVRSLYPTSYQTASYSGDTVLYYVRNHAENNTNLGLVEVNDNIKGDVARIFLYVYVRWQEPNLFENTPNPIKGPDDNENNGYKVIKDLDTLLEWCKIDPVDEWEMGRNDATENVQGNRNVFIDYPELAWLLFSQEMPEEMETPSGEAKNAAPASVITAVAQPAAAGTVTIDRRTVTASPKTGYEIEGYTLEPADAAIVTRNGSVFTLSKVTADCTLTVHFKARKEAMISYVVPAGVNAIGNKQYYVGDSIRLPSVTGTPAGVAYSVSFLGWTRAAVPITTSQPSYYAAGTNYTVTGSTSFHSLYSYNQNGTTYYLTVFCDHETRHSVHIEPTCTTAGAEQIVCDTCSAILSSTPIAAIGHDMSSTVIAPTCTAKGYTLYQCSRCDYSYKKAFTDMVDHNYETKTTNGVTTYTCTVCGDSYSEGNLYDTFSDLSANAWYVEEVSFVLNRGLMNGFNDGSFRPEERLTRAQLVTILYQEAGSPSVEGLDNPFTDLELDWYKPAILWAANNGIVNGVTSTTFAPDEAITREQIATIVWRTNGKPDSNYGLSFTDAAQISEYAVTAMRWAVETGLFRGDDTRLLRPTDSATRAELSAILMRYLSE